MPTSLNSCLQGLKHQPDAKCIKPYAKASDHSSWGLKISDTVSIHVEALRWVR
ncbi:unnamed protein product [Rhodiola kirilowii]